MHDESIAWAAGLYDGEGSASMYVPKNCKTARRQMQVSQAGDPGVQPHVLVRFREIVGEGNITGPYRGRLYYWKTTRKEVMDAIARQLWPYLSDDKKRQFISMTTKAGRQIDFDSVVAQRAPESERAWAAGLFDGEGSVWVTRNSERPNWLGLAMEVPQSNATGVPAVLTRFRAVVGVETVGGPRTQRNPWSKLPQYRWRTSGKHSVSRVIRLLWPWLGVANRTRLKALRSLLDADVALLLATELPG